MKMIKSNPRSSTDSKQEKHKENIINDHHNQLINSLKPLRENLKINQRTKGHVVLGNGNYVSPKTMERYLSSDKREQKYLCTMKANKDL